MFGIGMPELIVIALIALIVVGPKKLPEMAKTFGKGLAEFRKATEGATDTLKESLNVDDLKQEVDGLKDSLLHRLTSGVAEQPASSPAEEKKEAPPANASHHGPANS